MPLEADRPRDEPSNSTVLVVDDDRDFADTCEYWLRGGRHEVLTAYDGEDAVETIDESVDVVLLDRRMPGMSGDEVLDQIREVGIDCRVAMLTAVEPDTDIIDMPFDEYLVKPVTRSEVRETVADLLARGEFEEDVQDYLARESTERVLSSRDTNDFEPSHVDVPDEEEALLERRQRAINRLTRLNAVIRDIDQAIVDANGRAELEQEVCESLASTEPYVAAVSIEYSPATNTLTADIAAGTEIGTVDLDPFDDSIRNTVESESVTVLPALSAAQYDGLFVDGPGRQETTVGVVPLTYRNTVYGVLLVGAVGDHVFTDREVEVFEELGRTIGNGLNAVAQKQLLAADSLVELEFRHADDTDPFIAVARREECSLRLDGFAPAADGSVTCFITASDAHSDDVVDAAIQMSSVTNVRVVAESSVESLLEWSVEDGCLVHTLVEFGANVRTLDVSSGVGQVVATVAADTNFSAVVDAVTSAFPGTTLAAKREVSHEVRTTGGFGDDVDRELTDRQRDVLEAAYASGYFQWPRESTAEEVAESLDISPPTFHEHLRTGQRKLLDVYMSQEETRVTTDETDPQSEIT